MLRPRNFVLAFFVLLIVGIGVLYLVSLPSFVRLKERLAQKKEAYGRDGRTVTVIFLDITDSDTGRAWVRQPFRDQFLKAVNASLRDARDVLAIYLMHAQTRDVQPFWTNYPLSSLPGAELDDSTSAALALVQKEHCLEAYDSLTSERFFRRWDAADSVLTSFTDMFGALQQAALYFRVCATAPADRKRVVLLSDARENAGTSAPSIKLNEVGSVDKARSFADAALVQLRQATDIRDELQYADIYLLSPNERMYSNNERNLRRIFWEDLLVKNLRAGSVHFF